jgi:hypothetical protein
MHGLTLEGGDLAGFAVHAEVVLDRPDAADRPHGVQETVDLVRQDRADEHHAAVIDAHVYRAWVADHEAERRTDVLRDMVIAEAPAHGHRP